MCIGYVKGRETNIDDVCVMVYKVKGREGQSGCVCMYMKGRDRERDRMYGCVWAM